MAPFFSPLAGASPSLYIERRAAWAYSTATKPNAISTKSFVFIFSFDLIKWYNLNILRFDKYKN